MVYRAAEPGWAVIAASAGPLIIDPETMGGRAAEMKSVIDVDVDSSWYWYCGTVDPLPLPWLPAEMKSVIDVDSSW